jgi:hypothetical protein
MSLKIVYKNSLSLGICEALGRPRSVGDVWRNVEDGMKQLFDPSKPHLYGLHLGT